MKVGVVGSVPFNLMFGGGETQLINTVNLLQSLGVDVEYFNSYDKNIKYDVVHIFGAHYWHYNLISLLKAKNIPIVLSTISYVPGKLILKKAWKYIDKYIPVNTTYRLNHSVVNSADLLLPNSQIEAEYLKNYFDADEERIRVVSNGINNVVPSANKDLFFSAYGFTDYILCVGKIEARKNQLKLVELLRGTNYRCVFVGSGMLNDIEYYEKFKDKIEGNNNILHIDYIEHNSDMMASLYLNARVHVLLGINETPGLVNLEAGLYGCNLIVWDCLPVREYLKEYAHYVNESNLSSFYTKLEEYYSTTNRNDMLSKYIYANFTWKKVAEDTLKAYKKILK